MGEADAEEKGKSLVSRRAWENRTALPIVGFLLRGGWGQPCFDPEPDVEFVDVRAAIFSPADGMLWIVNAANETKVQIVRIDPLTGETGRAATFAWDPTLYPTHTLGLDSNGKVLLVASSTNTSKTMRLEVNPLDGKIRGTGLLQHEFPQTTPPVSAFGETSFVREDTAGQVVGIDRSHTIPIGATLSVAGMFK